MEINVKHIEELLSKQELTKNGKRLLEFILKNKRLPKSSVKEESNLYQWCGRLWKNKANFRPVYREICSILESMGWNSFDGRRKKREEEFFAFVEEHERLPESGVKEEHSLYTWCCLVSSKEEMAKNFPSVYAKLKEMRFGEKYDIINEKRVKEFFEFIEKRNRLPLRLNSEERSLYEWCRQVRYNMNNLQYKNPEVYEKIIELTEPKQIRSKYGNDPDLKCRMSMDYILQNNRLPSRRAKSIEERALGNFCIRVLRNNNNLAERFPQLKDKILMFKRDVQNSINL